MGQPHLDPPAIHPAGEKVLTLKALHDGQISQLRELALAEWFTHGGQFQHGPLGIGQVTQPQRDQIDQPGRGRKPPRRRQRPPSAASAPLSSAPLTSSRNTIGLPPQRSASCRTAAASTGP
jgi:hypothetical protein